MNEDYDVLLLVPAKLSCSFSIFRKVAIRFEVDSGTILAWVRLLVLMLAYIRC